MKKLEALLQQLKSNPQTIKAIEEEVHTLVIQDTTPLKEMLQSTTELTFYALIILEKKIRLHKQEGRSLEELKGTMNEFVGSGGYARSPLLCNKAAEIYALLGLYEWPNAYAEFFDLVFKLLSDKNYLGFLILEKFLFKVNSSTEIDDKRRKELKKATAMGSQAYLEILYSTSTHIEAVVDILLQSMVILPKNSINCDVVFKYGDQCVDKSIELFREVVGVGGVGAGVGAAFLEKVVCFVLKMPVEAKFIEMFTLLVNHLLKEKVSNLEKVYEFVYLGLRKDLDAFRASLAFWSTLYKNSLSDGYYERMGVEILKEITVNCEKLQESTYTFSSDEDASKDVIAFITVLSKTQEGCILEFLKSSRSISRKMAVACLNLCTRRKEIVFEDALLQCMSLFLEGSEECVKFINFIDLREKEGCKLINSVLEKYKLGEYESKALLKRCFEDDSLVFVDEVVVNLVLMLGDQSLVNYILAGDTWNMHLTRRFFYMLRKNPEAAKSKIQSFLVNFMSAGDGLSFPILGLIYKNYKSIPKEVYEKIYENIKFYSLKELISFNSDFLLHLDLAIQKVFAVAEFNRLMEEWKDYEDVHELSGCTKSFVNVLEIAAAKTFNAHFLGDKIDDTLFLYSNMLIEFLKTGDSALLKKIYDTLLRSDIPFDTPRAVHYLLMAYSSSSLVDMQSAIVLFLVECIKKENGPASFMVVPNASMEKCVALKDAVLKAQPKQQKDVMKEFVKGVRGRPLAVLGNSTFKVTSQNFLGEEGVKSGNEFDFVGDLFYS